MPLPIDQEANRKREAVRQLVHAIEDFVQAKITYERHRDDLPWANRLDVDETREHLLSKIAELVG
jgi:hypothetical protein